MKKILLIFLSFLSFNLFTSDNELSFFGEILIKEKALKAKFQLIKDTKGPSLLRISLDSFKSYCDYSINRITAPQQTRGRRGILFSSRTGTCQFKNMKEEEEKFWNDIVLIDFSYIINEKGKLEGDVELNSVEKTFHGELEFE